MLEIQILKHKFPNFVIQIFSCKIVKSSNSLFLWRIFYSVSNRTMKSILFFLFFLSCTERLCLCVEGLNNHKNISSNVGNSAYIHLDLVIIIRSQISNGYSSNPLAGSNCPSPSEEFRALTFRSIPFGKVLVSIFSYFWVGVARAQEWIWIMCVYVHFCWKHRPVCLKARRHFLSLFLGLLSWAWRFSNCSSPNPIQCCYKASHCRTGGEGIFTHIHPYSPPYIFKVLSAVV